jgi:hypothetical protein
MKAPPVSFFIRSSGVLLLVTGIAKLISAMGSAEILTIMAPILNLSFRNVFILAGLAEIAVAMCLLLGKSVLLQVSILAG